MSLQFKHGSYTTKNFDMCADAVKEFNKAAKDEKVDKQKMLKAARAVDKYLGMEKKAKEKGSATNAQLDSFMNAVEDAKTAISDAGLKGHTYHKWHVADMKKYAKEEVKEGLGDMAHMAEKDHEVQMARADLYKIAKYSIKLHEMLKGVSEAEGLEGWVQSKITKAADYLGSVYHHLDYEQVTGELGEGKSPHKKGTKAYKKHMAAMHAESANDPYKAQLRAKLAEKTNERSLTKGEEGKREKYVKGMKKAKGDFKDRYGKDAEAVMYATATKMAKK